MEGGGSRGASNVAGYVGIRMHWWQLCTATSARQSDDQVFLAFYCVARHYRFIGKQHIKYLVLYFYSVLNAMVQLHAPVLARAVYTILARVRVTRKSRSLHAKGDLNVASSARSCT